jgi:hypothetical protein
MNDGIQVVEERLAAGGSHAAAAGGWGRAAVAAMVQRVDSEAGVVERPGEPAVTARVLGRAVCHDHGRHGRRDIPLPLQDGDAVLVLERALLHRSS